MGFAGAIAEVISPVRCAGCDVPGGALCARCGAVMPIIHAAEACTRCGAAGGRARCEECRGRQFAFEAAICAGRLEPPLSRAVTLYKDAGERRYGPLLGALLAGACRQWRGWPDAVAAVPATRAAVARRGFDHTAALAAAVARELRVPVISRLGVKRQHDQRVLGREERFANMESAFLVLPGESLPARVLLVDDVFTTGATFDGAARALLAAGSSAVRVAALARA